MRGRGRVRCGANIPRLEIMEHWDFLPQPCSSKQNQNKSMHTGAAGLRSVEKLKASYGVHGGHSLVDDAASSWLLQTDGPCNLSPWDGRTDKDIRRMVSRAAGTSWNCITRGDITVSGSTPHIQGRWPYGQMVILP